MFKFNATGYVMEDRKGFEKKLLPKGNYDFEIVEFVSKAGDTYPKEGTTKNGDPKVDILCQVTTPGEFEGERVFHSVTFLPIKGADGKPTPGAGMAIHFLKTINQPWEGEFDVDTSAWVGEKFRGYVIQDEYNGRKSNKIKGIEPINAPAESGLPF